MGRAYPYFQVKQQAHVVGTNPHTCARFTVYAAIQLIDMFRDGESYRLLNRSIATTVDLNFESTIAFQEWQQFFGQILNQPIQQLLSDSIHSLIFVSLLHTYTSIITRFVLLDNNQNSCNALCGYALIRFVLSVKLLLVYDVIFARAPLDPNGGGRKN